MIDNRNKEIVLRLHEKTLRNEINWQKTSEERLFQASLPNSMLTIYYAKSGHFTLSIYNDSDDLIESISDTSYEVWGDTPEMGVLLLNEIYEQARAKALDVSRTLDEVLRVLS